MAGSVIAALLLLLLSACLLAWIRDSEARQVEAERDEWIRHAIRISERCRQMEELLGIVEQTVEKWRRKP